MKNYILLVFNTIFTAILFAVPSYSEEPDCSCSSPYIQKEITVPYQCEVTYSTGQTVTVTCYAHVIYCCRWDAFEPALHLKIECVAIHPGTCYFCYNSDPAGFFAHIRNAVAHDAIFNQTDCIPPNIPDCGSGDLPIIVAVKEWSCKYWENVWGWHGYNEWITILRNCEGETSECIHWYKICKDYFLNTILILEEGYEQLTTPGCSTQEPQLPPEGKSDMEHWRTQCFAPPCP